MDYEIEFGCDGIQMTNKGIFVPTVFKFRLNADNHTKLGRHIVEFP